MFINYLPLSTHNINDFMQHHIRKCTLFRGVYAADELKKIKVVPGIYIINCDTSNLPGSHWICIYFSPLMQGYYFDSYGIPPYIPQHKYFLIKNSKHCWKYNKVELQSLDSSVCGHYCCLFVMFVSQGHAADDFAKKFYGAYNSFCNDALTILNFTKVCNEEKKEH